MSKSKQQHTKKSLFKMPALILVGLLVGFAVGKLGNRGHVHEERAGDKFAETRWTCSMHPQIILPKPGKCPLCAMDLIPLEKSSDEDLGRRQLKLSDYARELAGVRVTTVQRRMLKQEIRMVGKIETDETRQKTITAWMPGRLDRLYVDYTGVKVEKGDHLVYLFSPDLIAAQEELIQSAQTARQMTDGTLEVVKERTIRMVETSREKLRLLGLTAKQISEIEQRGTPDSHLNIYAPISGVVLEKHAKEGMYVQTGSPIYQIADLSVVWLKLDAYESDVRWLHYGQEIRFESETYPGETFTGRIAFIDPVLDAKTRTVKVRVNVANKEGRLKPGMFVRAVVDVGTTNDGRAFTPELAGKFISPMHPEVIKDEPGTCDVCGMDLVPIEKMGYATDPSDQEIPLVIPASAPLITGKRAVVYLQVDEKKGIYEGRDVTLGPRVGGYYVVRDGLAEGDVLVTQGAFKIDSAIQIQAGPSMMNPEEVVVDEVVVFADVAQAFRMQLAGLFGPYLSMQEALGGDALQPAHEAAQELQAALKQVDMSLLKGRAHTSWMALSASLTHGGEACAASKTLAEARVAFETLSIAMISLQKQFDPMLTVSLYEARCPMAFDYKGASWFQSSTNIFNPYFGAEMLECGVIDARYPAAPSELPHDHSEQ